MSEEMTERTQEDIVQQPTARERLVYSVASASGAGLLALGLGFEWVSIVVAGAAGGTALYFSPELKQKFGRKVVKVVEEAPAPKGVQQDWRSKAVWALTGEPAQPATAPTERCQEPPQPKPPATREHADDLGSLEEILQGNDTSLPGKCTFSSILEHFTPTRERIFLGYLPGRKPVFVAVDDLCHIALVGSTGNGKSTLIRLIASQLAYVGVHVLILNPHYTSYDLKKKEDWTPIENHLYHPPVTDGARIGALMRWVAETLLEERLEKYRRSIPWGDPLFVIVDELPAIRKHAPQFPEHVTAILREGRKVGIFLVVASQDFLVKTIGPDEGGAVRKNYMTAMYVGGDQTSAKVLLNLSLSQITEQESNLGQGVIMMRNATVKQASLARVPYVDNDALYTLLGPSTYIPADEREEDDLVAGLMSPTRAEAKERHTDPLPVAAPPRYHSHEIGRAAQVQRARARAERLRATPVVAGSRSAAQEPLTQEDALLERALAAYDDGNRTIDALAVALKTTSWKVRPIYQQVKAQRK